MAASIFIVTEQKRCKMPLWTVLEDTRLRPQTFDTIQYRKSQVGQPLWTVLEDIQLRPQTFETEPLLRKNPLWTELADAIRPPSFDTEPTPSQPFIDSLTPVTVGSIWRYETLEAAKFNDNVILPTLFPVPLSTVNSFVSIFIPCGDRIPEFGDIRVENNYTLPSGPGLNDNKTILFVNGVVVYMNGSPVHGWTVVSTPNVINGFDYDLTGPGGKLPVGLVTVSVYLEGVESFFDSFSFDVTESIVPPFLYNRNPVPDAGGIAPNTPFWFDVLDDYNVVPGSLKFYIDGNMAYNGTPAPGAWCPPFDGYIGRVEDVIDGYDGYRVRIDHSTLLFPPSSRVNIRVIAMDAQSNILDETYGIWISPALIEPPKVDPYENTLSLFFSGDMEPSSLLDGYLFKLSNLSDFSNKAFVRKVDMLAADRVRLWVEWFQGDGPFTLTVSNKVRDIHDGYLIGAGGILDVFQSDAAYTNTNGLVRSWHESRLVTRDGQRAFLAGARGIDVFDVRLGLFDASRWGQVLDAYGIGAMCLVKSGDGYEFSGDSPPQLCDQLPAPETTVPSPDAILFSIIDNITSVETVSLVVYISGLLVFSGGSGGWANNWGGQITVHPHQLDVELYPSENFSLGSRVSVRVVASNLLGQLLDSTYGFNIAP